MKIEQHIENLKKLKSFHNGSYGVSVNAAINALKLEQVLGEAFNIALLYGKEKGMEAIDNALYQMGVDGIKEQEIEVLEQESYKVSEYDKDHIWYKGRQYISLHRFLEVKKALEQEPKTGYWIVHEIESTLKWLECSNCHCETSYNVMHNYCPNCGAKMQEVEE